MAVKMKALGRRRSPAGPFFTSWLLYFILTIAVIGALLAYLLSVPLYLLGRLFPRADRAASWFLCEGIGILMSIQPWLKAQIELDVNLKDHSPAGRLLVSNHRSHLDAFILLSRVRGIRILAKSSLFYIPFLGLMMRLSRQIPVERGQIDAFFKAMDTVGSRLRAGETVHIFPEMTRCELGHPGTLNFSVAPFRVAMREGVSVVPIVFDSTDEAWPKGRFGLSFRKPISVKALPAIESKTYATAEELRNDVRRSIDEALLKNAASGQVVT